MALPVSKVIWTKFVAGGGGGGMGPLPGVTISTTTTTTTTTTIKEDGKTAKDATLYINFDLVHLQILYGFKGTDGRLSWQFPAVAVLQKDVGTADHNEGRLVVLKGIGGGVEELSIVFVESTDAVMFKQWFEQYIERANNVPCNQAGGVQE